MKTFAQFVTESHYGEEADATKLVERLKSKGYVARFIGGFTRDKILGLPSKDIDVVTSATPDQVIAVFGKENAQLVGASFGVVVVKTSSGSIDVATMRTDGVSQDQRRPDSVTFTTDPYTDSLRRDFTASAIGFDPTTGEYFDYHNGIEHLKKGVLKTVGKAEDRFNEDLLRVCRLIRFACSKNLTPDAEAMAAAKKLAPQITKIAPERISQELLKSLEANPAKALNLLHQTTLLVHILPEVDSLPAAAFHLTTAVLEYVHRESATFALAAIFCQLDPKVVQRIGTRLKLSNDEQRHVLGVLALHPRISSANQRSTMDVLKKLMREQYFQDALRLYEFRVQAHDPHAPAESLHFLKNLYAGMKQEDLHPEKFISGDDLLKLGKKAGPDFRKILDKVEIGQLTGQIKSREQALALIRTNKL